MTRTKRGNVARNRRKNVLFFTKGFRGSASQLYRTARQRLIKALNHSYTDRKKKKQDFIQIWISRINSTVRNLGLNYSIFQYQIKYSQIILNKKVCGQLLLKDQFFFKNLFSRLQLNN